MLIKCQKFHSGDAVGIIIANEQEYYSEILALGNQSGGRLTLPSIASRLC